MVFNNGSICTIIIKPSILQILEAFSNHQKINKRVKFLRAYYQYLNIKQIGSIRKRKNN